MSDKKIKIQSTRFGELEVPEESVFQIIDGMIGFPTDRRFVILEHNPPFSWMQSADSPELAFVVVNAGEFGESYQVPLPFNDTLMELEKGGDNDVAILTLVSVRPDPTQTTVNLKAPVVVNLKNRRGRQIVIEKPQYSTRFPLWAPAEGEKKEPEK